MKLSYNKNSPDPIYYVQKSFRNGKKSTTKNIKRIGKHSDLLKITDDPLAYAKQVVDDFNRRLDNDLLSLTVDIDFNKRLIVAKSKSLNIGYFFFQKIYHDLRIRDFISAVSANRKIKYNAD